MTREEAIKKFEKQLHSAMVVLDSGFGTRPGESDRLYRERKELAEIAISALRQQDHFREVTKKVEPLTLDELRKMDGEPVYCVEITGREEWLFRRDGGFADMYGEFTSDDFMSWDNYGKLWWCYRQKPEEGTV